MPGPITPRDPSAPLRTKRGFQHITGQEQNVGTFFAGPAVAPVLPPTFRAIVTADIAAPFATLFAAAVVGIVPLTTKGDLFTFTTVPARLPVGFVDQTLIVDPTQATGLIWKPGCYMLYSNGSAVTNSGVLLTQMHAIGVPAGQLKNAGNSIEVESTWSFNGGGGLEVINVLWGSQTLATISPNGNAGAMRIRVMIVKQPGSNLQSCIVDFTGSVGAIGTIVSTGTQNDSIGLGIVFQAQSLSSGGVMFQNATICRFNV